MILFEEFRGTVKETITYFSIIDNQHKRHLITLYMRIYMLYVSEAEPEKKSSRVVMIKLMTRKILGRVHFLMARSI